MGLVFLRRMPWMCVHRITLQIGEAIKPASSQILDLYRKLDIRQCGYSADPSHFHEQPGGQTVTVRDPAGVNPAGALTATHSITDHLIYQ